MDRMTPTLCVGVMSEHTFGVCKWGPTAKAQKAAKTRIAHSGNEKKSKTQILPKTRGEKNERNPTRLGEKFTKQHTKKIHRRKHGLKDGPVDETEKKKKCCKKSTATGRVHF